MKPRNFPERRRRRQMLAECRALEWTHKSFRTPILPIGSGSRAEVAAVNAQLDAAIKAVSL